MAGVVVCHTVAPVRDRLIAAASGVQALVPVVAASSVDELVAQVRRLVPDVVLIDAHLSAPGAVEGVRLVRSIAPGTAIVLLAGPGDEAALDRALALGARGYLSPDVGRAELAAVAAHVLASPVVPQQSAPLDVPPLTLPEQGGLGQPAQASPVPLVLTKREIEVLTGMSNGRSNAQIGADLFLSEDTVKTHARRLFRKLGAADRAQAVAIGLRRGIIH